MRRTEHSPRPGIGLSRLWPAVLLGLMCWLAIIGLAIIALALNR